MTIHYHGMPISPREMLIDLAGKHVCISYATRNEGIVEQCLRLMQSVLWDNGAFSFKTQGTPTDWPAFYRWVGDKLAPPHWAVIPDVIDGTVEEQRALVKTWPFPRHLGAPVWHLGLPIGYLLELVDEWPRVCLGSSGAYWQVGQKAWAERMDEVYETLYRTRTHLPWIHGLRMMAQPGKRWPLASVDSVNVVLNYKRNEEMPGRMADRIDRVNGPLPPAWPADLLL